MQYGAQRTVIHYPITTDNFYAHFRSESNKTIVINKLREEVTPVIYKL